jgi:hypothetical protein
MSLRDTSWVLDTANNPIISNSILITNRKTEERQNFPAFGWWRRTRTVVTREWILLTKAGATNAVANAPGDTNITWDQQETNRVLECYKVVYNKDSVTEWTKET